MIRPIEHIPMINKLTPEQELKLAEYRDRYFKIGFSTEPADKATAEDAMRRNFEMINHPLPPVVWVSSPNEAYRVLKSNDIKTYYPPFHWGQLEAGWIAKFMYCHEVLGVQYPEDAFKKLLINKDLVCSCGPIWAYENLVVMCDRPEFVEIDNSGDYPTGKSARYRDGWTTQLGITN